VRDQLRRLKPASWPSARGRGTEDPSSDARTRRHGCRRIAGKAVAPRRRDAHHPRLRRDRRSRRADRSARRRHRDRGARARCGRHVSHAPGRGDHRLRTGVPGAEAARGRCARRARRRGTRDRPVRDRGLARDRQRAVREDRRGRVRLVVLRPGRARTHAGDPAGRSTRPCPLSRRRRSVSARRPHRDGADPVCRRKRPRPDHRAVPVRSARERGPAPPIGRRPRRHRDLVVRRLAASRVERTAPNLTR
jgi:hypothetical protein